MAELVREIIKGNRGRFGDCRSITVVGTETCYVTVEEAHEMIHRDPRVFFIDDGLKRIQLIAVYDAKLDLRYVRTCQEDTSDDPLLKLPEPSEAHNLQIAGRHET